jgi:hypothetical protein
MRPFRWNTVYFNLFTAKLYVLFKDGTPPEKRPVRCKVYIEMNKDWMGGFGMNAFPQFGRKPNGLLVMAS